MVIQSHSVNILIHKSYKINRQHAVVFGCILQAVILLKFNNALALRPAPPRSSSPTPGASLHAISTISFINVTSLPFVSLINDYGAHKLQRFCEAAAEVKSPSLCGATKKTDTSSLPPSLRFKVPQRHLSLLLDRKQAWPSTSKRQTGQISSLSETLSIKRASLSC